MLTPSAIYRIFIVLSLLQFYVNSALRPYHFPIRHNNRWMDNADDNNNNNHHPAANGRSTEICQNFTREFLGQMTGGSLPQSNSSSNAGQQFSPFFGWISAIGSTPLNNETDLAVRCLAIMVSPEDLVVERKCIRAIITSNPKDLERFAVEWSGEPQEQTLATPNDEPRGADTPDDDYDGGTQRSPFLFRITHRHRPPTAVPCVFPISDQIATHLAWTATVCGISKNSPVDDQQQNRPIPRNGDGGKIGTGGSSRIACHPIQLNHSSSLGNGSRPAKQQQALPLPPDAHRTVQQYFVPRSSLFLFNGDGLRAIGSLGPDNGPALKNAALHLFNKQDCLWLRNSTQGRVQCAPSSPSSAMPNPAAAPMLAQYDSNDEETATSTSSSASPTTMRAAPSTEETLAMVVLLVFLVLVLAGMLLTIALFLVRHHRRVYYNNL